MAYANADALAADLISVINAQFGLSATTVNEAFAGVNTFIGNSSTGAASDVEVNLVSAVNTQYGTGAESVSEAVAVLWQGSNDNSSAATQDAITQVAGALAGAAGQSFDTLNMAIPAYTGFVAQQGIGNQLAQVGYQNFLDAVQEKAAIADAISGVTGTITSGRISRLQLIKNGVTLSDVHIEIEVLQAAFIYGTTAAIFASIATITDMAAGLLTQPPVGDSGVFQGII